LLSFVRTVLTEPEPFGPIQGRTYPTSIDPWAITYELVGFAFALVPIALVLHLLKRGGDSASDLGLDSSRPRRDAMVGLVLTFTAVTLTLGATELAGALGLPLRDMIVVNRDAHPVFTAMFVIGAARAGLTEEIIVNGYLIHRLGQLDFSARRAILASAGLRATYHIYQGEVAVLGHLVTGLVAATIFTRTRRLWPLIFAHFAYNVVVYFSYYFLGPMR
jgi:membrane protease YdiL (CAAX protease family)